MHIAIFLEKKDGEGLQHTCGVFKVIFPSIEKRDGEGGI